MPEHAAVLFANDVFYLAFANQDFEAMQSIWAAKTPVTCIHPGWDVLSDREDPNVRLVEAGPGDHPGVERDRYPSTVRDEALKKGLDRQLVLGFARLAVQLELQLALDGRGSSSALSTRFRRLYRVGEKRRGRGGGSGPAAPNSPRGELGPVGKRVPHAFPASAAAHVLRATRGGFLECPTWEDDRAGPRSTSARSGAT